MLVVVDSGSTKADWSFIPRDGEEFTLSTMGFNPNFHSTEMMINVLKKELLPQIEAKKVHQIVFYGSGCWDVGRKEIIAEALRNLFPQAVIEVHHDLLACARATCGNAPGIACILGTGSNSVLYDGKVEVDNVTNLGYLLGDEGSGSHLGKKLIRAYYYRELPQDLMESFEAVCLGGKGEILDNLYRGDTPAVYLASFAKFMSQYRTHPYIKKMVYRSFEEFIDRHICKYEGYQKLPIHFIGSIAFYFQNILEMVLEDKNLIVGKLIRKPIDHLVAYHKAYGQGQVQTQF